MSVDANEERARASALPTAQLIVYIVGTYHEPLRQMLPELQILAIHAAHDRGRSYPVLEHAASTTTDLLDATFHYLDEYDREVFPVLGGRRAPSRGFGRTLARVRERGHEILRLVLRIQRAVAWLRGSADATAEQCELVKSVDALASTLAAQVELETGALLARAA